MAIKILKKSNFPVNFLFLIEVEKFVGNLLLKFLMLAMKIKNFMNF